MIWEDVLQEEVYPWLWFTYIASSFKFIEHTSSGSLYQPSIHYRGIE